MKTSPKEIAGVLHLKSLQVYLQHTNIKFLSIILFFSKEEKTTINRHNQPIIFFNGQSPSITIQQNKSAGFANKQNIPWL